MPQKNNRLKNFERINAILNSTNTNYMDKHTMDKIVTKKKNRKHTHKNSRKPKFKIKRTPILRMDYLKELMFLRVKGKDKATYHHGDEFHNANNCSDFSVFRGLASFKFVKLNNIYNFKHCRLKQITFSLTKYGKNYVDKYFPKYKRIYPILKTYLIINSVAGGITYRLPLILLILFILLMLLIFFIPIMPTFVNNCIVTVFALEALCIILIPLTNSNSILKHLAKKKLIKKSNLTKDKFTTYLSEENIKEPSVNFDYDDDIPLISSVIFIKPPFTISQMIKRLINHFLK